MDVPDLFKATITESWFRVLRGESFKKHYQQKEEYEGAPTTGVLF